MDQFLIQPCTPLRVEFYSPDEKWHLRNATSDLFQRPLSSIAQMLLFDLVPFFGFYSGCCPLVTPPPPLTPLPTCAAAQPGILQTTHARLSLPSRVEPLGRKFLQSERSTNHSPAKGTVARFRNKFVAAATKSSFQKNAAFFALFYFLKKRRQKNALFFRVSQELFVADATNLFQNLATVQKGGGEKDR